MPIGRIILKAISESNKLAKLKTDGARLLYTWLIPHLDINGCFNGDPVVVGGKIFTRLGKSVKEIDKFLTDLEENGLIVRYQANGDVFLFVPDFKEKQPHVNTDREAKGKIPLPTPDQLLTNSRLTPPESKSKVQVQVKSKVQSKTPASAGTPQAEFVNNWSNLYQTGTGHPYKAGRVDYIIIAGLLKDFGEVEVLFRAKILFEGCKSGSLWFAKDNGMGSFTIKNLKHKWNELIEGGKHGKQAGVSNSELESFLAGRE